MKHRETRRIIVNGSPQEVQVEIDPEEDAKVGRFVNEQRLRRAGMASPPRIGYTSNQGWNMVADRRMANDFPHLTKAFHKKQLREKKTLDRSQRRNKKAKA